MRKKCAYGFIFIIYFICKINSQPDSLVRVINSANTPDTVKMKALYELASALLYNKPDTVLVLSQTILEKAINSKSLFWQSNAHNLSGAYYFITSRFNEAITSHEKALAIRKGLGNKKLIAMSLNNLGIAYQQMNMYSRSAEYFFESLKIYEELKNRSGLAMAYGNLGVVYSTLGQYEKALQYQFSSLKIEKENGNRQGEAQCYTSISSCYGKIGKKDSCLKYENLSLEISKQINDKNGMAISYKNLANSFAEIGQFEKAMALFEQCLTIEKELSDRDGEALSLIGIGDILLRNKKYNEAIAYGQNALTLAKEYELKRAEKESLKLISDCYKAKGNLAKAMPYFEKYVELNDSLNNVEINKSAYKLELKYEFDKKENTAKAEQLRKDTFQNKAWPLQDCPWPYNNLK